MRSSTTGIATQAVAALRAHATTLSVAESCTGGMIGAAITSVRGASDVFLGGVIAYSNEVKTGVLGVAPSAIDAGGAVCCEVVTEMAAGAARVTGAGCGVSVSGVAGPDGGTPAKPVGLVWIGVHTPNGTHAFEHHFDGDRESVRRQTVDAALGHLLDALAPSD